MTKPLIGIGSDVYIQNGERDRAFVYTTYVDSLRPAGGTLIQHIESDIDHASEPSDRHRHGVAIDGETRLARILGERELDVNSSHHQAIKDIGQGLRVAAHAPDGIVEGLEDPRHPFYVGVQWHPEDMAGEASASAIFGAFVEAARHYAEKKREAATELSPAAAGKSE